MSRDWESVNFDRWQETDRLSVPGGWVYRSKSYGPIPNGKEEGEIVAVVMAFVPVPGKSE